MKRSEPQAGPRHELEEAMALVAQGDQIAFARVYDLLSSRIFGLVLRILVDRAQSEEVTQEVFLTIWQQAPRFDRSRGSVIAWALSLAHGKAVDRVRSSQSQRNRDARSGLLDMEHSYDSVSEIAELRVDAEIVRTALGSLPALQREVIVLAYYEGYTQSEIAKKLETPLGTVKTRLRDGMIKLRTTIGVQT